VTRLFKPHRTRADRRCPLSVGLLLSFLVPFFFLCVACASPLPSENTPQAPSAAARAVPASPLPASPRAPQALTTPTPPMKEIGISLPPSQVPTGPELEDWIQSLAGSGITMVLLDIGTREGAGQDEEPRPLGSLGRVYFRTGWAETARDVYGELLPVAHQHGLSVFAAVSLRRMNWVDPTLGWVDRSYDTERLQLRLSPYLDVFHPAFQEYLMGLLMDLVDTGIDGVLFRNDAPLGPTDGFSVFALRGFERDFQTKADPGKLSPVSVSGLAATRGDGPTDHVGAGNSPESWQWAGWKAREVIKIMAKLKRAMQAHASGLRFGLEVHSEAITDPLLALVQYAEDLLEGKRSGFQYFLIRPDAQDDPIAAPLIERMGQLIGDTERIWVSILVQGGDFRHPESWLSPMRMQDRLEKSVGLIYIAN
jgi:hypothetical protein